VNAVLDDLDSRPGSTTSLLRTVIGSTMRDLGGWMASSTLVALMTEFDVPSDRTRTALTRLKTKGLLVPEARGRVAGYGLTEAAIAMLVRGDRRIYHPRFMDNDDHWCLISFSVPEQNRDVRHQLRRRLSWIGCGVIASALWICPAFLVDEVEEIVADLGLRGRVTVFLVDEIRGVDDLPAAISRWWDLDGICALHHDFLASHADAIAAFRADPRPRTAFRTWTVALDAWRPIPYLDPGLPPCLLPNDWPGHRSIPLFMEFRDSAVEPAAQFVRSIATKQPLPSD